MPKQKGKILTNPDTRYFFWGWMWGIAGTFLAVPLLVSVKILCEHVPAWSPLKEFLGK